MVFLISASKSVSAFSAPVLATCASFSAFSFSRKTFSVNVFVVVATATRSCCFLLSASAAFTDLSWNSTDCFATVNARSVSAASSMA